MKRTVLTLLVIIGLPMVINAPVSAQGSDCSWQFSNCTSSANSNCTASCTQSCPQGDDTCINTCRTACLPTPLGNCVLSREGCVGSGGTDSGCGDLYSTCSQVADSVGGACFDDYAQCQYATNVIDRSKWMSGEYDMNCLDTVTAEYYDCLSGGNPGCVSQITGTVFGNCCVTQMRQARQECLVY